MKIIPLCSVLKSRVDSVKVESRVNTEEIPVRRYSSHTTVKRYTNFNSLKLEHMDILSKLQNSKFNV
jgi:transcriptional regulator NrdR family protein